MSELKGEKRSSYPTSWFLKLLLSQVTTTKQVLFIKFEKYAQLFFLKMRAFNTIQMWQRSKLPEKSLPFPVLP